MCGRNQGGEGPSGEETGVPGGYRAREELQDVHHLLALLEAEQLEAGHGGRDYTVRT